MHCESGCLVRLFGHLSGQPRTSHAVARSVVMNTMVHRVVARSLGHRGNAYVVPVQRLTVEQIRIMRGDVGTASMGKEL